MKKVIVVSKTHLDLGFTDTAENIRSRYVTDYIPAACDIAQALNDGEKKRFVWTTGSWILLQALQNPDAGTAEKVRAALQRGDLAPHAMPFTLHTELLDADSLDYGLSLVEQLDALTGRKTTAAKMTDVPGHTIGLLPVLAKHGIHLLHIGVNGASAMPEVPECFLWKMGQAEVVVIYNGSYGGSCRIPGVEEILYFSHTADNRGAKSARFAEEEFQKVCKEFPDYEVCAGRMDDFGDILWEKRDTLPVVTGEIGDTWIHGSSSDPYKSAALRELLAVKDEMLAAGEDRNSPAMRRLYDGILCTAEHTCGLDQKMYLSDYEHYPRPAFDRARAMDDTRIRHPFRGMPYNLLTIASRRAGGYRKGSYRAMENSWQEQRDYIRKAAECLPELYRGKTLNTLHALRHPQFTENAGESIAPDTAVTLGNWTLSVNRAGACTLMHKKQLLFSPQGQPALVYLSLGKKDYDFWFSHYTRDFRSNYQWSAPDFGKPLLEYAERAYPQGEFPFAMTGLHCKKEPDSVTLTADLQADMSVFQKAGCPASAQIAYTLSKEGLQISVMWKNKPASRLPEEILFRLYPVMDKDSLRYEKCGSIIDPMTTVKNGGRKLSAVQSVRFACQGGSVRLTNRHAPLVSWGVCNILRFDNRLPEPEKDGLSFVLQNNIWGTNFPQWYDDDGAFAFLCTMEKSQP